MSVKKQYMQVHVYYYGVNNAVNLQITRTINGKLGELIVYTPPTVFFRDPRH